MILGLRQGCPQPTVTLQNQLTQRRSNRDWPNQSSPWLAIDFRHQNPRGEGRVAVLGFETRRNSNQLTVSQDLARSCNYLTKSRLDLDGSGLILAPVTKLEIDRYNLTPDETQTSRSNESSRSVLVYVFIHPKFSGRVWVRHKYNSAQPMDSPTWDNVWHFMDHVIY